MYNVVHVRLATRHSKQSIDSRLASRTTYALKSCSMFINKNEREFFIKSKSKLIFSNEKIIQQAVSIYFLSYLKDKVIL